MTSAALNDWNAAASSFDNEPDHGLRDPHIREAWTQLLAVNLPEPKASILDIGCGTGSLSVVMAGLGHEVIGIDFSPAMIALAETKAAAHGHTIPFHVMDAATPQLNNHQFDAIVCRHLLWALPDIVGVLNRWTALLKPAGRLLLIEGYWHTGAGLHAQQIVEAMPESFTNVAVQPLSQQVDLWDGVVNDERYLATASLAP